MPTAALYVLACIVPIGVYLALRPRRSQRKAQISSALCTVAAVIGFAGAVYSYAAGSSIVIQLISSGLFVVAACSMLLSNRVSQPYGNSQAPRIPR